MSINGNIKPYLRWFIMWCFLGITTMNHAGTNTNFNYLGSVLKSRNADCEEYQKPDGSIITKCRAGEKAVFKDGTVIVRFPDGRREISYPDGSCLSIQVDGTRVYKNKDGLERTVSMDGKTPFGEEISAAERVIKKGKALVRILFSAQQSDEQLRPVKYTDPDAVKIQNTLGVSRLFDDLIDAYVLKLKTEPVADSFSAMVIISQCRYCHTGFCKRKNIKGAFVEIIIGKERVWEGSMSISGAEDPVKRRMLVSAVLENTFRK